MKNRLPINQDKTNIKDNSTGNEFELLTHTFNASKKLTADSLIKYSYDGKVVYKKLSHIISIDPLYIWNKLYGKDTKLSLAGCAHKKLMQVMQQKYPDLYAAKEKKRLRYKSLSNSSLQ